MLAEKNWLKKRERNQWNREDKGKSKKNDTYILNIQKFFNKIKMCI